MSPKLKRGVLITAALAALAGGGVAAAAGGGDEESGPDDGEGHPVTGAKLQRASAVALRAAGGGAVTGSERDDEEGFYEIEVTRPDASQVDVHLDRRFDVIDTAADGGGDD